MTNQLTELTKIPQREEGLFRRVFVMGTDDLTVWQDPSGAIVGFQLTRGNTAITFTGGRLSVDEVDFCEKDNLAPVLRGEAVFDPAEAIAWLKDHGSQVDEDIRDYITAKIVLNAKTR